MILKTCKSCIIQLRRYCSSKNFNWTQIISKESRENFVNKFCNANTNIRFNHDPKILTYSAVLVPMIRINDEYCLLYTLRSSKLRSHRGEISFPGGKCDEADQSYIDCALRETEEEIGLNRSSIDVWVEGPLVVTSSQRGIVPVVGVVTKANLDFENVNHDEVDKVFSVPIRHLCAPENFGYTQFRVGYSIPVFLHEEGKIWGVTGDLTHMFLKSLLPKDLYTNEVRFIPKYKHKIS